MTGFWSLIQRRSKQRHPSRRFRAPLSREGDIDVTELRSWPIVAEREKAAERLAKYLADNPVADGDIVMICIGAKGPGNVRLVGDPEF